MSGLCLCAFSVHASSVQILIWLSLLLLIQICFCSYLCKIISPSALFWKLSGGMQFSQLWFKAKSLRDILDSWKSIEHFICSNWAQSRFFRKLWLKRGKFPCKNLGLSSCSFTALDWVFWILDRSFFLAWNCIHPISIFLLLIVSVWTVHVLPWNQRAF